MIQALFYQRERENEQFGARDASRSYAIGVDGGGSKTLAVVVDAQGNERGRGIAGSANYATVGIDQAVRQIHSAVEEAARAASCSLPLSAAWLGLAGIDRPGDNEILLPHLRSVAEFILLTNDAELVLSALDDAVGIALIAGTGSIARGVATILAAGACRRFREQSMEEGK
jgi:glucosamine kinase